MTTSDTQQTTGPDYEAAARQATWDEAHNRLTTAANLARSLDEIGLYITRAEQDLAAYAAKIAKLEADIARARADEEAAREKYNHHLGTGTAMRDMVLEHCEKHGLPIPKTPEPAPPASAPVVPCDPLTCQGCAHCGGRYVAAPKAPVVEEEAPAGGEES